METTLAEYQFMVVWPDSQATTLTDDERKLLGVAATYTDSDDVWNEAVIGPVARYATQIFRVDGRKIVMVRSDKGEIASWP